MIPFFSLLKKRLQHLLGISLLSVASECMEPLEKESHFGTWSVNTVSISMEALDATPFGLRLRQQN